MRKISEAVMQRSTSGNRAQRQDKYVREPIRTVDGQVRIKKYQKIKIVGQGAYSKCYLVRNIQSDSTYVVKIIPKKKLQALTKEKLVYEIKIHKSLSHPNIVYFDHWFQDENYKYLFMEYCQNGVFLCCLQNLQDKLKEMKRMPQFQINKYVRQIVDALRYIHTQNVLHRDLKLCNFYLDQNDNVKLGDFGFACQLANQMDRKRQTCGTPNYIAPEAISGFGYSFSSDVWAVGVILFRLKYGQCPFEGQTVKQTLTNVKICNYSFPTHCKISTQLKDLIQKIFNLNYDDRLTTDQILAHKFFEQQDEIEIEKKTPQKRGFSLSNLFSRQKPKKQVKSPRKGIMQRSSRNDSSQKKTDMQPKRSNSCEALKQMKQIFKNKSRQTLVTTSVLNTKSDFGSFSSIKTTQTGSRQTNNVHHTNLSNLQATISINGALFADQQNTNREENSRSNRLNDFIKAQVNSISFKEQFKKNTGVINNSSNNNMNGNRNYLIKQQQMQQKKKQTAIVNIAQLHNNKYKKQPSKKPTLKQALNKQKQNIHEQLSIYSKKYNLPVHIYLQNNIVIVNYGTIEGNSGFHGYDNHNKQVINIQQVIYEEVAYIVYQNRNNIFSMTGERVAIAKLPKILRHIIQHKLKMQDIVVDALTRVENQDEFNQLIDAQSFVNSSSKHGQSQNEEIHKMLSKLPDRWIKTKDGILLQYGYGSKFIVSKQYNNDSFYMADTDSTKIHCMYQYQDKKGEFQVNQGVVIENYYSAWTSSLLKSKAK